MVGGLFGRLTDHRHIQVSADYARDVADRHTFVGDRMIVGSGGSLFQHEPVQNGSVEHVHSGPAVESIANLRRNALLARHIDNTRDETMIIAVAVDLRKAHQRNRHASRHYLSCCLLRSCEAKPVRPEAAACLPLRSLRVSVGRRPTSRSGDGQSQRARTLDRTFVGFAGSREIGEVVDKAGVDHAIRIGHSAAQAHVADSPDWQQGARRLVDILITGSRPMK
jgi:hypothetical protein